MLDQIVADNPGRTAPIEWHLVNNGSPMYSAEARAKSRLYPPPLGGLYYTPWLWCDGVNRESDYNSWGGHIDQALARPAVIQLNLTGTYDPDLRTGEARVEFVSDTAAEITATACLVITEDSIYYEAANTDNWHNHVCRDYIPDQVGTIVTVPAQGRETLTQSFTIDPSWNAARCNVLAYFQTTAVQPDSSRPSYNAGLVPVMLLTGMAQPEPGRTLPRVCVEPSPVRDRVTFRSATALTQVLIRGIDGRLVRRLGSQGNSLVWDRRDESGRTVPAGVYLYEARTEASSSSGKLILVRE